MKRLLPILLALLLAVPAFSLAEEEKVLNILTWADYIDSATILEPFMAETGIRIEYNYFESNEEMLIKLQATEGGTYDIILASDYIIDMARKENLLYPLNRDLLPNWDNIDPVYRQQFYDPDDQYTIPYIAGTPLLIYDPAYVDIDITGYESLWDESLRDSLVLMDDARNIIGITLKTMGQSFNVTDPEILEAASEKLMQLKPNIRVLDYNRADLAIVTGEASVGYMFTEGILRALEAKPDLQIVYPVEGMGFGIDALFIPANAPHPENAHALLDFMLRPEIGAVIAEERMYLCVNEAAYPLLSEEYRSNPALNIPPELLEDSEFIQDVGDAQLIYNDIWTKFKQY